MTSTFPRIFAFVLAAGLAVVARVAGKESPLVLVEQGEARCVVVLGRQPSAAAEQAAGVFIQVLRQMSGAEIPLAHEEERTAREARTRVFIGDSATLRAQGLESSQVGPEGILLQSGDGFLALLGSDLSEEGVSLKGTLWAVETFLERLGVCWLWPGELGAVVPQQPTILTPPIRLRYTPAVRQRVIRNLFYNARLQKGLDALGWAREDYEAWGAKDAAEWFERQKCGSSLALAYGHAFGDWWEKYGQTHPEYFALQPDGSRSQQASPQRSRLCLSNPAVIRQVAREKIEFFDKNPAARMASISLNDGGKTDFCLCARCVSWDVPERGTVPWGSRTIPNMSDRVWRFSTEVATLVAEKHPDKFLGAYAYSAYRDPPMRIARLPDNLWVGFVGFQGAEMRDLWAQWTRKTRHLFLRPNGFGVSRRDPLAVMPHQVAKQLKYFLGAGCVAVDVDAVFHTWAIQGLDPYVAAKLLWDPSLDVDALIDDYCRAGFGKAAPEIRRLFDDIERHSVACLPVLRKELGEGEPPVLYGELWKEDDFTRWEGYLQRAEKMTTAPAELARLRFFRSKIRHARLLAEWEDARILLQEKKIGQPEFQRRQQALVEFYKKTGMTWAFSSAYLRFYGL